MCSGPFLLRLLAGDISLQATDISHLSQIGRLRAEFSVFPFAVSVLKLRHFHTKICIFPLLSPDGCNTHHSLMPHTWLLHLFLPCLPEMTSFLCCPLLQVVSAMRMCVSFRHLCYFLSPAPHREWRSCHRCFSVWAPLHRSKMERRGKQGHRGMVGAGRAEGSHGNPRLCVGGFCEMTVNHGDPNTNPCFGASCWESPLVFESKPMQYSMETCHVISSS